MRLWLTMMAVLAGIWLFGPTSAAPGLSETGVTPPASYAGRQILLYDPAGDGRIVEAVGDLTTARHITILVPGVDCTLANFDPGHGRTVRHALSWQMRQVYGQLRALEPETPAAVVAWLGYDPPEGVGVAAAREDRAAAGARALDRFVDDLLRRDPSASITLVGHSYGSVVLGLAASTLDRRVTDLIAIGSPGMGVDRAVDLHAGARVWAGSAAADWTRRLPGLTLGGAGHGRHPYEPAFGALPLPVDGVDGHDGYFVSGSASLLAIAAITLGERTPLP